MKRKRISASEHKIEKVMHEFKHRTLRSGSGHPVVNRDQAMAIAMSDAREVAEAKSGKMHRRKRHIKSGKSRHIRAGGR